MKRKTETARVDTEILEMKEMNRYPKTIPLQGADRMCMSRGNVFLV